MIKISIGNRIKIARENKKISQKQLAEKLSKTQGIITAIEHDKNKGNFEILKKICEILEVTPNYIILGNEEIKIKNSIISQNSDKETHNSNNHENSNNITNNYYDCKQQNNNKEKISNNEIIELIDIIKEMTNEQLNQIIEYANFIKNK